MYLTKVDNWSKDIQGIQRKLETKIDLNNYISKLRLVKLTDSPVVDYLLLCYFIILVDIVNILHMSKTGQPRFDNAVP